MKNADTIFALRQCAVRNAGHSFLQSRRWYRRGDIGPPMPSAAFYGCVAAAFTVTNFSTAAAIFFADSRL